jgi:hypothetical protein
LLPSPHLARKTFRSDAHRYFAPAFEPGPLSFLAQRLTAILRAVVFRFHPRQIWHAANEVLDEQRQLPLPCEKPIPVR